MWNTKTPFNQDLEEDTDDREMTNSMLDCEARSLPESEPLLYRQVGNITEMSEPEVVTMETSSPSFMIQCGQETKTRKEPTTMNTMTWQDLPPSKGVPWVRQTEQYTMASQDGRVIISLICPGCRTEVDVDVSNDVELDGVSTVGGGDLDEHDLEGDFE